MTSVTMEEPRASQLLLTTLTTAPLAEWSTFEHALESLRIRAYAALELIGLPEGQGWLVAPECVGSLLDDLDRRFTPFSAYLRGKRYDSSTHVLHLDDASALPEHGFMPGGTVTFMRIEDDMTPGAFGVMLAHGGGLQLFQADAAGHPPNGAGEIIGVVLGYHPPLDEATGAAI